MADQTKWVYATQLSLETTGASIAAAAYGLASSKALVTVGDHLDYPLADFVLACRFSAAGANGVTVDLFRWDQNIDSTNDAPVPQAGYTNTYVGSFPISSGAASTTMAYYPLTDIPLVANCGFYIRDNTAVIILAGWTLKCTPKTWGPV